ncbi:MAG: AraC family transcriptional regulator [Sphaerochaeta sp.]|jgi:AraC-like DNA-binding protein
MCTPLAAALTDFCATARLCGALFTDSGCCTTVGSGAVLPPCLAELAKGLDRSDFRTHCHEEGLCVACPLGIGKCWIAFWPLPAPPSKDNGVVRGYVRLLREIVALHVGDWKSLLPLPDCYDWRVQRVIDELTANMLEMISLDQLASQVGMANSSLCRLFKRETGHSITSYLQLMRIEQSLSLLNDPLLSITEISLRCGFSDPSYFSRIFKQTIGVSAKEYRRQLRPQHDNLAESALD